MGGSWGAQKLVLDFGRGCGAAVVSLGSVLCPACRLHTLTPSMVIELVCPISQSQYKNPALLDDFLSTRGTWGCLWHQSIWSPSGLQHISSAAQAQDGLCITLENKSCSIARLLLFRCLKMHICIWWNCEACGGTSLAPSLSQVPQWVWAVCRRNWAEFVTGSVDEAVKPLYTLQEQLVSHQWKLLFSHCCFTSSVSSNAWSQIR